MRKEIRADNDTTHGHNWLHGHAIRVHGKQSLTYQSWRAMLRRCTNPNHRSYPRYGGSGVTVAPDWRTFGGFLKSMGVRPEGTTLGRACDLAGYWPGQAFWMTATEQGLAKKNKRALLKWFARSLPEARIRTTARRGLGILPPFERWSPPPGIPAAACDTSHQRSGGSLGCVRFAGCGCCGSGPGAGAYGGKPVGGTLK
jgi:hypothetical protein